MGEPTQEAIIIAEECVVLDGWGTAGEKCVLVLGNYLKTLETNCK